MKRTFTRPLPFSAIFTVFAVILATTMPVLAGAYEPEVKWKETRDAFSTPPEPFVLEVEWSVAKGFGERLDVEINGGKTASHLLPGEKSSGILPLKFDGKKLGAGEHVIRVSVWQGDDKHRDTRGFTQKLRVLVAGPADIPMPKGN